MWATAEIIHATRLQVLVETGTHTGGSAHLWAMLLKLNGGEQVITVDNNHSRLMGRNERPPLPIRWVKGDSVQKLSTVEKHIDRRRAMVILDSDHSREHVAKELRAYAPLVAEGCSLICQDTGYGTLFMPGEPGPWPAV